MPASPVESRYNALCSSIDEGYCVIQMLFDDQGRPCDYRFLEVNPAFVRHTGLHDAVGKTIRQLAPEHESYWYDVYGEVALTGRPVRFVSEAKALEGRWFDVQAFRVGDAGRCEVGVLFSDITHRRATERALARQHDTFYQVIQNNPFGVYVVDADFKLRQVSLGAQKVFEKVHPLLGRDFAEILRVIWGEPLAAQAIERFRHTLDTGEPFVSPGTIERRHDADEMEAFDWRIERITLPDGRYGVVCYFYDLSERLRWERAIRESEERLLLAIAIARMGTFEIDLLTDAVEVNDTGRAIYGWTPDEPVTFAKVQTHFHPADGPEVMRRVAEAFDPAGPGAFELQQRIVRVDGEVRWIKVRGRAIFDDLGGRRQAVRCLGTYLDVTEQRLLQQRIEDLLEAERAARAEAERASEAKSDFLAALSHELRTPLTPVLLTVSLMETYPNLSPQLRDDLAMIRRNVELESRLISDLLDLTRITRGKLQLDIVEVDIHSIVRSAIEICQREASANLVVELAATSTLVQGDATRLQQIFWNLVNNAIKFTPAGNIVVRSRDVDHGRVLIEIEDNGMGIDPEVLPKLFAAFEQGDVRAARQHAGLGLGLAISKRLTEVHGGTIEAASPGRGCGATFRVTLPAAAAQPPAAAVAQPTDLASTRALSILLVEDHDASLAVMTRLLRVMGHQVATAGSVATALAAANRDAFDLIISDLGLPDGSGLDVIRQLRQNYAGRAIALTGYGMDGDIAASREAGFAEHLTKPVDVAALAAAIGRVASGGK
jgi:PAS domain S-box-containing protein